MKKADELIDKYISAGCLFANATQCAIICVEEIMLVLQGTEYINEWRPVLNELKSRL